MGAVYSVGKYCGERYKATPRKEIAFQGKCQVVRKHDGFWGLGRDYRGPVLIDPTWGKLNTEAGRSIKVTGDQHHIYFEGATVEKTMPDGTKIIHLFMGS